MDLKATVQNGRIVLADGVTLPDGMELSIRPVVRKRASKKAPKRKSTGFAGLAKFAVKTGISDLAEEHDHYAYGTPKRSAVRKNRRSR